MIIVILLLCVGLVVGGLFVVEHCDGLALLVIAGGLLGILISVIAFICLCVDVSKLRVIDEKIEMYQEENAAIESEIDILVKEYMDYESEVFKETTTESSITLVSLYPELKADELVSSQLNVYLSNNQKIKELKEERINGSVSRWWLYFGG